jgi:hypothetical protein
MNKKIFPLRGVSVLKPVLRTITLCLNRDSYYKEVERIEYSEKYQVNQGILSSVPGDLSYYCPGRRWRFYQATA